MNFDNRKIKNNKKIRIFIIFLILSFIFWFLIKLSEEYVASTEVQVFYEDLPKNKLMQTESTSLINVKIKSMGFNLLREKIKRKNITISLANVKKKQGTIYYYLTSNMLPILEEEFSKSEIESIKPDTLFFDLGKSVSKKVKVVPNIELQYALGYNLSGKLKIEPEFITISGPENLIDTIFNVKTSRLNLKNISKDIDEELFIIKSNTLNNVKYSSDKVNIKGSVEKFTEGSMLVDFEVINIPKSYTIVTYPKQVKLIYQVGLSDYNTITPNDFLVVCDFRESSKNELNYLIPRLNNVPVLVKEVKIVPNTIEFLLEK